MRKLSANAKATLMLCSRFVQGNAVAPYSNAEWNKLAEKLLRSELKEPAGLLRVPAASMATILDITVEEASRIESLVSRGVNMAFYLEDLDKKAIYPITRGDAEYPLRLKKMLGKHAPPVLYGCGDIGLANRSGIAMVGSRSIDAETEAYAADLAQWVVSEGLTVFSGGAKGIDQVSERAALSSQGSCVSVLADSMLKRLKDPHTVRAIMDGKLLLLTAASPHAPFSVGMAMARNKYVYAMARAAFVVASSYQQGGTWNGAVENLKAGRVRTYVWNTAKFPGNIPLIEKGALAIPARENGILQSLLEDMPVMAKEKSKQQETMVEQLDLFSMKGQEVTSVVREEICSENAVDTLSTNVDAPVSYSSVYRVVLPIMLNCLEKPKTTDELAQEMDVTKKQLSAWLAKAVESGVVHKLHSPVRYARGMG